jgi:hypothetical protein
MAANPCTNGTPCANGSAAAAPSEAVSDGRGANGRFQAGNKFSKGNPFARRVASMRTAALEELSPADIRLLVRKLFNLALTSCDTTAAALVLRYAVGPPLPGIDPDSLDSDEWKKLNDGPGAGEFCIANIDTIPTAQAVDLLKQIRERMPADPGRHVGGAEVLAEQAARRRRRK